MNGTRTFLCAALIIARSTMHKTVILSVTKAEFIAATSNSQHMIFKLTMILEMDNKHAGQHLQCRRSERHIEKRQHYFVQA